MAWIRDGVSPEQIKVSFIVSAKEHPELARFILDLPYRGVSKILREILSSAVKAAAATAVQGQPDAQVDEGFRRPLDASGAPSQTPSRTQDGAPPVIGDVSSAAAGIIQNFDKMFPS